MQAANESSECRNVSPPFVTRLQVITRSCGTPVTRECLSTVHRLFTRERRGPLRSHIPVLLRFESMELANFAKFANVTSRYPSAAKITISCFVATLGFDTFTGRRLVSGWIELGAIFHSSVRDLFYIILDRKKCPR